MKLKRGVRRELEEWYRDRHKRRREDDECDRRHDALLEEYRRQDRDISSKGKSKHKRKQK